LTEKKEKWENPTVKNSDHVIVVDFRDYPQFNGCEMIVTSGNNTGSCGTSVNVKGMDSKGKPAGNYYTLRNGIDKWKIADRTEQAKRFKVKAKALSKEVKRLKHEAEILEKYDSDEEYVAFKLQEVAKTKDIKKGGEILKELKRTNLL
jgi:hypothetical protein